MGKNELPIRKTWLEKILKKSTIVLNGLYGKKRNIYCLSFRT